METDAPRPIDGGARYLARAEAKGWEDTLHVLGGMLAGCPPDAYPLRVSLAKSAHGARVHLTVVYQVKGAGLPRR